MSKQFKIGSFLAIMLMLLPVFTGCGSGNKGGSTQVTVVDLTHANRLGNANCLQCHNAGKDLTMINDLDTRTIGAVYQDSVHFNPSFAPNANGEVQCEDCHGGGQYHWGLGPLANPTPDYTVCLSCHAPYVTFATAFADTGHANTAQVPDKLFFQAAAGTDQAADHGQPEFISGTTTPVQQNQHIEQCSVCHNSNQRFVYDINGNLTNPDPNNMPAPRVNCASCHDAHQVGKTTVVATQSSSVTYPIFRKVQVDGNGANDAVSGVWMRPMIFQPNGVVQANGSVDMTKLSGTNNEINPQILCASCHTVGLYKISRAVTHQLDIYSQYKGSGHGNRQAAAFAEFSANPTAYVNPSTGLPYTAADAGHQSLWPYDMALSAGPSFNGPGQKGATASLTQNAAGGGGSNDNYPCYRCHNGISSVAFQNNVQGTAAAPVVFGDVTVTCITCHDPHQNTGTLDKNVRKPVMMTNYSTSSVTIQGNVFLDTQPVPDAAGQVVVCIFCHQGRESGLTLYKTKLAPGKTITGSFFNPHYLGTAAMLWGANGYEFAGKSYSVNASHQGDPANCNGCHMGNPTSDNLNGGHTWKPNVASCNASSCHGSFNAMNAKAGSSDPDVANYRANFDTNNYTGDAGGASLSIATSLMVIEGKVIAKLATMGLFYNDRVYPYFFSDAAFTTPFTAWTPAAYKAAFNLQFVIKGLPSSTTSQATVPNSSAAVHNFQYTIQLLWDSYEALGGTIPVGARPAGSRAATVYGPGQ